MSDVTGQVTFAALKFYFTGLRAEVALWIVKVADPCCVYTVNYYCFITAFSQHLDKHSLLQINITEVAGVKKNVWNVTSKAI